MRWSRCASPPPTSGLHRASTGIEALLDQQTSDGVLRPWWAWWPPGVLEAAVPDPAVRATLRAEMPRLPRRIHEEAVPVPDGWATWPAGYVQLSGAYGGEAVAAQSRGWPYRRLDGHRLGAVTDPEAVLEAVASAAAELSG